MARDRIWFALARHGIEIPTATQSIRLTQWSQAPAPEPAETVLARRVESLERVGMLHVLGAEQMRRLAAESREVRFAAGEPVIRQGEPGDSMFVILDGTVEVVATEAGAGPAVIARLGPGDYFGEMSLMTGAPRTATIQGTSESRLLEVGKVAFRQILEADPALLARLTSALEERLSERARALATAGQTPEPPPPDLLQRIREFFAT